MARALKVIVLSVATLAIAHVASGSGADRPPEVGQLTTVYSFDTSHGMPVEGALSYVVLRRKPGGEVLRAELKGDLNTRSVSVPVTPGRYRVSTFQRTCSGNCGLLDPSSHGCGRDVRIHASERVRARVRVRWVGGKPCRMRLSR